MANDDLINLIPTGEYPGGNGSPAPSGPTPSTPRSPSGPLTTPQNNAYDALMAMLKSWGLQELAPDVLKLIQDGHDQSNIPMLLQDTPSYKKRFAGNEIRKQKGMPVLSPGEYLATEQSYRQIMQSNGLPAGFYDQPSDFADWIGKDVAPQEVQTRVGYAVGAAQRLDDGTKRAFQDYYGVTPAHLTAFFLDQGRAMPQIQQAARAAQIGGATIGAGLGIDKSLAERLATSNVSDANLGQTSQQMVTDLSEVGKLSQLHGGDSYGATEAGADEFFGDAEAKKRRQRLVAQEQATFAGNSGVGKSSLAVNKGY